MFIRCIPVHDITPSPPVVRAGQISARFVFLFEYLITQLRLFAHSAPSKGKPDKVMQFLYEGRQGNTKENWLRNFTGWKRISSESS
jgi:hypothetical protein